MAVVSLLLGHYNKDQPFNLYQIQDKDTLLFKLDDIAHVFNLSTDLFSQVPHYLDKDKNIYLTTTELAQASIKHNKFLLAELCKLKTNDYVAKLDKSILSKLPRLVYHESKKDASQYQPTAIELVASNVKLEPTSPSIPPLLPSNPSDPMALDHIISSNGKQARRLSRTTLEEPPSVKKQRKLDPLPKPLHTVSSQQPTLLAKRLGNNTNNNKRNLTIYAPSYAEQFNGIRSAPLNSNFRQVPAAKPHPLSQATMVSPSNSSTTSEFAIPPIVPSQQQPPHTAHPSSMNNRHHSPQYPSSAYGHSFPVTSGRVEPPIAKSSNLQRQQFMQPFEHLFDTIETTRTLKSTLDDQIRRSSTLIQTLQASSTTIEGLVRNQIKEAQKEIMFRMEDTLHSLAHRLSTLERRLDISSDSHTLPKQLSSINNTNNNHTTTTTSATTSSSSSTTITTTSLSPHTLSSAPSLPSSSHPMATGRRQLQELVSPPTIVRSQHDIGPHEYHHMLDTLRERLDRLERQLES